MAGCKLTKKILGRNLGSIHTVTYYGIFDIPTAVWYCKCQIKEILLYIETENVECMCLQIFV